MTITAGHHIFYNYRPFVGKNYRIDQFHLVLYLYMGFGSSPTPESIVSKYITKNYNNTNGKRGIMLNPIWVGGGPYGPPKHIFVDYSNFYQRKSAEFFLLFMNDPYGGSMMFTIPH
jgi:hypothetical protein